MEDDFTPSEISALVLPEDRLTRLLNIKEGLLTARAELAISDHIPQAALKSAIESAYDEVNKSIDFCVVQMMMSDIEKGRVINGKK